jgi:dihydroflavonol-4-reductase
MNKNIKKILLTGADGFLGSNLSRELLDRGYTVRAFVEHQSSASTLDGLALEISRGDLLSLPDLKNAVTGCSYIIHTAANTSIWPSRSAIVRRINIEGTRNIIAVAEDCHIEKMVFVGTANSFGPGSKNDPGDESRPYMGAGYKLDYMDSKYQAQQEVLAAVREKGLPAVLVNPTFMIGPYDSKPGTGAMILAIAGNKVPGYTRGGRNYIHVRDAAIGIANALEKGVVGENYILGNMNLTYKEAFETIADTIGAKRPGIYLPPALSIMYSYLATILGQLTGIRPNVTLSMARISNDDHYFSAEKAKRYLDLPQTDIKVAILESYEWLNKNGYLK